MDAWGDCFSFERWQNAFAACGIDPEFYACRARGRDELLPWSVTDVGVDTDYLWHEREQAYRGVITPDCRRQCTNCGARALYREGRCDD